MKYIKLFENFEDYDPYELVMLSPNKKGEMLVGELKKDEPNLNLISDLIALGANLDWREEDGFTALHVCASRNYLEIARMLIDAGADVNIQDESDVNIKIDGWTALLLCAYYNRPEIARMLIDAGADLNIEDEDGWTALHFCARYNHPDILRMLIDAGADKTIPNNYGKLPYELAKTQGLKELLKP